MKNWGLILLLAFSLSAHAYHIDDHGSITRQAFKELSACFPKAKSLLTIELIVNGDVDEDLDLFTKWLFYSHYYNPNKKLDMRRADSADRVSTLASTLRSPTHVSLIEMSDLGHMIHHYQDATVPSHVVPVDHSMWDGFETYSVTNFSSRLTCDQIASLATTDALTILKETAFATLANIQAFHFDFTTQQDNFTNKIAASGPAFWEESTSNEFGQYGYLRNHFGDTDFEISGIRYHIDDEIFAAFKAQQLQLATQATIRGLMWEIGDQLKKTNFTTERND